MGRYDDEQNGFRIFCDTEGKWNWGVILAHRHKEHQRDVEVPIGDDEGPFKSILDAIADLQRFLRAETLIPASVRVGYSGSTDEGKPNWRKKMKMEKFNVRGGRAYFSVEKAQEGGRSIKDTKALLEANGVTGMRREYSCYVGHYGFSVPAKFNDKTEKLVF